MEYLVNILLEKVLEAIYFSLFIIYGKKIKEKRLLFVAIMIFEYLSFKHFIKFNVLFQLLYTFMSFINLKVLYKEKAQITDIFLFASASIILIAISFICGVILFNNLNLYVPILILNRIIILLFVFLLRNKIYLVYKKFWNNWNKKHKPTIKSLTLRNISVIIFNLMFYIINIGMLFALTFK